MAPWRAPLRPPRSAAARSSSLRGFRPSSEADWKLCLGRRVSLRYRLHDDPEHPFSEALGAVQSVSIGERGAQISVVDRRGAVLTIDLEDIDTAKVL